MTTSGLHRDWVRRCAILALCGLGLLLQFWPLFFSFFRVTPSDAVDPRLNNLILENIHEFLSGKMPSSEFFNVPFYYPAKDVGTWTDTLWGAAPFYSFFRWMGLSMTTAYSSWILLLSTLNFGAAYFALNSQFKLKAFGSAIGAFLFAFGAPRMAQIGHAQLFPAFATPLFFGWLYQALFDFPKLNRTKWSLALVALVYQIYCGFYLGWFLCVALTVLALYLMISPKVRSRSILLLKKEWKFLGISGLIAGICLLPQLIPFLRAAKLFGGRSYSGLRATFPRWNSFFHVGDEHRIESWLTPLLKANELPLSHEHKMGIGLITTGLVILGFYWGKKAKVAPVVRAGLVVLLLIVLSISFFKASLWGLLYLAFPGGKAVRVASRIILILLFGYSVGLAYFFERIKWPSRVAFAFVVVLEQLVMIPTTSVAFLDSRVNQLSVQIPTPCSVFYLLQKNSPLSIDEFQMDAMMVAFHSGRKTLNGYYGHDPVEWKLSPGSFDELEKWERSSKIQVSRSCVVTI